MFKKFLLGLGLVAVTTVPAQADLIISEVVDATLPGGLPKFVELTNTGATAIDLSNYSIGNYNNGGTTLGGGASTVLSGMLGSCESYVISYENGDSPGVGSFFDLFGFDPDNFDLGSFINGDDVIALFLGAATGDGSDATLVDVYGVIGVDGSGEAWGVHRRLREPQREHRQPDLQRGRVDHRWCELAGNRRRRDRGRPDPRADRHGPLRPLLAGERRDLELRWSQEPLLVEARSFALAAKKPSLRSERGLSRASNADITFRDLSSSARLPIIQYVRRAGGDRSVTGQRHPRQTLPSTPRAWASQTDKGPSAR